MERISEKKLSPWAILVGFFVIQAFLPTFASSEEIYRFERMWPTLQQPWYFGMPQNAAIDNRGYVYVADSGNNRIRKFTSDGQFIKNWGTYGTANGEFDRPGGIAVDNKGNRIFFKS